ncbi:MAG: hypothetical protein M1817_006187 [Caeruleum heppii]|nr:MAG: hypothetical protein M1817_006187 [Caeruleum heppii]
MEKAATEFFSSTHFAVAGASNDARKYGYQVLQWYTSHTLPVTPLNPTTPAITITHLPPPHESLQTLPTKPSVSSLPASELLLTSLSIITPPAVTLKVLTEAKEAGVRAVWLQPGSFDEAGWEFAMREWKGRAVAGMEGSTRGGEGWCVLVDGEAALERARRETKAGKGERKL